MDTTSKYLTASELVQNNRSIRPEYMTMLDISELAGVNRKTVTKWQQRGRMPQPVMRLSAQNRPLYDREAITQWLVDSGRLVPTKQ